MQILRRLYRLLVAVLVGISMPLFADIIPLSMKDAIDKALQYSASLKSQQSYVSAATFNKYASYANFLPVMTSAYSYSFNAPSLSQEYSLNSINVSASMNLFRGFIDYLTTAESSENLARQKFTLHSIRANIILNTKLAYIRILQNKALLRTAEESSRIQPRRIAWYKSRSRDFKYSVLILCTFDSIINK